jgi:2-oxopent-4-enoate/cis-2-oxohex-4-enoate hydratase
VVEPLSERYPHLDIDGAYQISRRMLACRLEGDKEQLVGKKIGVTSKAVQEMLGVFQPDFGFLTDAMCCQNGDAISMQDLIQPRIEAEIAFELSATLEGTDITPEKVLAATAQVYPCFEVVDSRIHDWRIKITDTVADNASCGVYALGAPALDPAFHDLAELEARVYCDGKLLHSGYGSAVQGHPLQAVAWLANTLGAYSIPLKAGEVILSGSLVPLTPVRAGQVFKMELLAPVESGTDEKTILGTTDLSFYDRHSRV